jgi:hypothetical protein
MSSNYTFFPVLGLVSPRVSPGAHGRLDIYYCWHFKRAGCGGAFTGSVWSRTVAVEGIMEARILGLGGALSYRKHQSWEELQPTRRVVSFIYGYRLVTSDR